MSAPKCKNAVCPSSVSSEPSTAGMPSGLLSTSLRRDFHPFVESYVMTDNGRLMRVPVKGIFRRLLYIGWGRVLIFCLLNIGRYDIVLCERGSLIGPPYGIH